MPVYRTAELHLQESILSILQQTHMDFELCIVNDDPQDYSRIKEIIDCYRDDRIVLLSTDKHGGIAYASNMGIDYTQSVFIAMMDHDDICTPTRLALQLKFLQDNPEFGFIGGQAEGCYADGSRVQLEYPLLSSQDEMRHNFLTRVPFLNPSVMFRRSSLGDVRYSLDYKVCTDYHLFARLIFIHNIMATNLPDTILHYRFHDGNTSLKQCLVAEEETHRVQSWILQQQ